MARRYRPRQVFKFWLFLDKPEESRLIEFIEYSKAKRSFARIIRDGIRLMWSLSEGDTTVLFELFPGLRAQLTPIQPAPVKDNRDLERQIEELKKLILEQGSISAPPRDYPQLKGGHSGIAPTVQAKAAPVADAGAIADNFLAFIQ